MNKLNERLALFMAVEAAQAAGRLMRDNLLAAKKVNAATQHDIKLELDVRCQQRIEGNLRRRFPGVAVLGEEGTSGDSRAVYRWVVDPIDGTVNFAYGIPHACVSIALQQRVAESPKLKTPGGAKKQPSTSDTHQTMVGVVYDPFCDELWTGIRGQKARLNGRIIHVSRRRRLDEAIVSIGFAKQAETMDRMLPRFHALIHRVRKVRIMGSAALAMVYVASGRMDAYTEYGVRLWDIAAGGLILECAGGEFWRRQIEEDHAYHVMASNGLVRRGLEKLR